MKNFYLLVFIFAAAEILSAASQTNGKMDPEQNLIRERKMKKRNKLRNRVAKKWSSEIANWITTLANKNDISEKGFLSEQQGMMVVMSVDDRLKDVDFDKSVSVTDFGSGKLAIRVKVPKSRVQSASMMMPRPVYQDSPTDESKPAGSLATPESTKGDIKEGKEQGFGLGIGLRGKGLGRGLGLRPGMGLGRGLGLGRRFRSRKGRRGMGLGKRFQKLKGLVRAGKRFWRNRAKNFGRTFGRAMRRFSERMKYVCFIVDSPVSLQEASREFKSRENSEPLLTGTEAIFNVNASNKFSKSDLKTINPIQRRFCRRALKTGDVYQLTKGTELNAGAKTLHVLGQMDVNQPHASVPYAIQVDPSINLGD